MGNSICTLDEKRDNPKRHTERSEVVVYKFWWKELEGNLNNQKHEDVYRRKLCDRNY